MLRRRRLIRSATIRFSRNHSLHTLPRLLRMRSAFVFAALLVFALVSDAEAGRNAGGSAFVTWDTAGDSTTTGGLPAWSTPVYVHLHNAPEIRELAIALTISPADSEATCYRLGAPPAGIEATSDCGLSGPSMSYMEFGGDSTYDWSIAFSPDDHARALVAFYIAPNGCLTPTAATVALTSVVAIDSTGAADTLEVTGGALVQPAPLVTAVSPTHVLAGATSTLMVSGLHYRPGAHVHLTSSSGDIAGTTLTQDSTHIAVHINPTSEATGLYDLVVTLPDSSSTVAPDAVTVQSEAEATSTVNRPTDDANAYTRINIHNHIARWYPYETDIGVFGYPSYLNTDNLLVAPTVTDTVGLFMSFSENGVALYYPLQQMGFVRYSASNRTASSIGLLSMAADAINGGANDDTNRPFLTVMTHHANGDSMLTHLRVARHMRNQFSGTSGCGTYYATAPDDSLCHEVFSGPRFDDECFYDEQEIRIPKAKRGSPVDYVEVRSDSTPPGGTCPQRTTYLFGLSMWNRYRVANQAGEGVGLQLQSDWSDRYGGYYEPTGTLVGDDRDIATLGCLLTSICIVHGFYGISVTPGVLNDWLQHRKNGYGRAQVAEVTALGSNDTLSFNWGGPKKHGPTFLIERGLHVPVATVRIVGAISSGTGRGVVAAHYGATTVAVGNLGYVYNLVNPIAAAKEYSSDKSTKWAIVPLGKGPGTPAAAEAAMAGDAPVLINTRLDASNVAQHWVVGAGREPAFTSATVARGTYVIRDPNWPATRLLQTPHFNKFTEARACTVIPTEMHALARVSASADTTGFEVVLSGPASLEVTDPLGRVVSYDGTTDDYIASIPNADAWRTFVVEDVSDTTNENPAVDIVRFPGALDGGYLIGVTGQSSGQYAVSADVIGGTGVGAVAAMGGATSAGTTSFYRVMYSRDAGTVGMETTGVDATATAEASWGVEVSPNPVSNGAKIAYSIRRPGLATLSVFDLAGRCVRKLNTGAVSPGQHSVVWDGRGSNNERVRAGVYFVRLESGNERIAKRIVVLQ
jgi:FlgD Ig-like domain